MALSALDWLTRRGSVTGWTVMMMVREVFSSPGDSGKVVQAGPVGGSRALLAPLAVIWAGDSRWLPKPLRNPHGPPAPRAATPDSPAGSGTGARGWDETAAPASASFGKVPQARAPAGSFV